MIVRTSAVPLKRTVNLRASTANNDVKVTLGGQKIEFRLIEADTLDITC